MMAAGLRDAFRTAARQFRTGPRDIPFEQARAERVIGLKTELSHAERDDWIKSAAVEIARQVLAAAVVEYDQTSDAPARAALADDIRRWRGLIARSTQSSE